MLKQRSSRELLRQAILNRRFVRLAALPSKSPRFSGQKHLLHSKGAGTKTEDRYKAPDYEDLNREGGCRLLHCGGGLALRSRGNFEWDYPAGFPSGKWSGLPIVSMPGHFLVLGLKVLRLNFFAL